MSCKYLINNTTGTYYNVVDDTLNELPITELTAQAFSDYGNDAPPDGNLLMELENVNILKWTDEDTVPNLTVNITAIPQGQTVVTNAIDLTHESVHGVESVTADAEELIVAVSKDMTTWKAHNGTEWVTLSEQYAGMSKEQLESITTSQWAELIADETTEMYLRIALTSAEQAVRTITIDFLN